MVHNSGAGQLEKIEEAKKDPALDARAREIERWVSTIDPNGNLDKMRAKMVKLIVRLLPAEEQ